MEAHPQHAVGTHQGEEEDHPEKKSVLMKVKEKAKKIKNTLTKHGHDEEDDVDIEGLEVHDATNTSEPPGQGGILKQPMKNFGDTSAAVRNDKPLAPIEKTDLKIGDPISGQTPSVDPGVMLMHDDVVEPRAREEIPGQHRGNVGRTPVVGGLHSPQNTPASSFGEHKSNVGDDVLEPRAREEISGQDRGNVGRTPVVGEGRHSPQNTSASSFGEHKSNVGDEGHLGQTKVNLHGPRGSDENIHVPPANVAVKEGHFGQSTPVSLGEFMSKSSDPSHTPVTGKEGHLGQSGVDLDRPRGSEEDPHAPKANPQAYSPSNYETKVTDPTPAGGEEVGITPISKLFDKMNIKSGGEQNRDRNPVSNLSTGSHDQFSAEENPSNQGSSYTEKISNATSAIACNAISAKNVVAAKLGYGGNIEQHDQQGKSGEKPTPVHEKVAEAGSTAMPKTHGGDATGAKDTTGLDKGVSVKGYLSEKLRPNEEDRALSEVITETLQKRKSGEAGGGRPEGKVTESAEVTRRLGPDQGEEQVEQSSYGKVVADTLRGAVGSLFGKADQSQSASASPQSRGSSTGTEGLSNSGSGVEERRSSGGVEQPPLKGN